MRRDSAIVSASVLVGGLGSVSRDVSGAQGAPHPLGVLSQFDAVVWAT